MNTNGQRLTNNLTAVRVLLTRATRVNQLERPTGPFSLVGRIPNQLVPCGVANALIHPARVAVLHVLNVQMLEGDNLKTVHQVAADLVRKILAPVRDALVDVLHNALALAVFSRSLLACREAALRFGQRLLILAKEARVGNVFAGREGGKLLQPHVYARHMRNGWKMGHLNFARETGVPVAQVVALDGQRLDFPLYRPVQVDTNVTNSREAQAAVLQQSKPTLRKGEDLYQPFPLKRG